MTRSGCDLGPYESCTHWSAAFCIVVRIERSDAFAKAAYYRRTDRGVGKSTVHPPDRPLARLCVERSRGYAPVSGAWNLKNGVVDIRIAAHQRLVEQRSFELDPFVTIDEAVLQLSMMNLPVPHQKVEVMQSRYRTFGLACLCSRTRGGLRDRWPRCS
jgi:hypothetical protein